MRRWTDGRCWSASRVSGCFLTYRELEVRKRSAHDVNGPRANQYKIDGLIKQSFSMTTTSGRKLHIVSYYTKRDLREGRKWFLKISLASQYMNDFDDEMIASATSIYAMRYIDDAGTEELRKRFGFSATALERFKYECLGPTPTGAPFLVLYKTKLGTIEQLLINTASPLELWALTTTFQSEPRGIGL